MTNLLEETMELLESRGKSIDDVVWVGSKDGFISKELFLKLADVRYDRGFGGQEIADDLMVVGDNWWLERGEYDGSEWWEFKSLPTKPKKELNPIRLNGGIWTRLSTMEYEDNY